MAAIVGSVIVTENTPTNEKRERKARTKWLIRLRDLQVFHWPLCFLLEVSNPWTTTRPHCLTRLHFSSPSLMTLVCQFCSDQALMVVAFEMVVVEGIYLLKRRMRIGQMKAAHGSLWGVANTTANLDLIRVKSSSPALDQLNAS